MISHAYKIGMAQMERKNRTWKNGEKGSQRGWYNSGAQNSSLMRKPLTQARSHQVHSGMRQPVCGMSEVPVLTHCQGVQPSPHSIAYRPGITGSAPIAVETGIVVLLSINSSQEPFPPVPHSFFYWTCSVLSSNKAKLGMTMVLT